MPSANILAVKNLHMRFGGIIALNDLDISVKRGSITALIGPNGAGKTTLFNCLTGFYKATSGEIRLFAKGRETDIVKILGEKLTVKDLFSPQTLPAKIYHKMFGGSHLVNRAGLARTFQNIRLFKEMTAIENLMVAQHMRLNGNLIAGIIKSAAFKKLEIEALDRAWQWVRVFHLESDANRLAGELPYGLQRRLEIARAMCTNPDILCLDEPAAGLNPLETKELSDRICMLNKEHNVTILLIEHDMSMVMDISHHVVVIDHGEVIARGLPEGVANDPAVISAYLGTEKEAAR